MMNFVMLYERIEVYSYWYGTTEKEDTTKTRKSKLSVWMQQLASFSDKNLR